MGKTPEVILQSELLDWLSSRGIFHWRNNTGAFRKNGRYVQYGYKGSPDIIAIIEGFFVGIEVKPGDKKQSEEQVKFEGDLTRAGGFYRVIRNVDELSDFVDFVRYGKHLTNV